MAIEVEIYEKIRYYHEHTDLSKRKVAEILGVSRNTVKKYWDGETVPWERKPGSGRKNDVITDEVKKFILSCFETDKISPKKQKHTAHKIYERLVSEMNFTGCEASVRRAVAELRCNEKQVFIPLAYEPAESIQIDWGEATVFIAGVKQKVQIWCMRECSSCDIFVKAFYRQNAESFHEGIVDGLEYFGGSPQKMIFDNARIAVKEGFGYHAKATDKYLALAAHYAFKPVFCNVASGHEKGLVEGLVGLARRNFFVPMPRADSIDELNKKLREDCLNYRNHRIPGRNMTVGEMVELCKDKWIPLPPYRFDPSITVQVKADDFSLVRFDHNKYSVPYRYSSKMITVKGSGNKLTMISNGTVIAKYDRDYRYNQTHYVLEHYIGLIEKRPRSVYNAAPIKQTVPEELYSFLMKLPTPKEIVKVLKLYIEVGDELLAFLDCCTSYDALSACVQKSFEPTEYKSEIKVILPDLKRYDSLLKGGELR